MLWIRAGGGCVKVGGTVWNILKEGGTEKTGGEAKILKRKGQAGWRDGCLKNGARSLEPPYEIMMFTSTLQQENNRLTRSWSMFLFCTPLVSLCFEGYKIENWQRLSFNGILTIARTRFYHFIFHEFLVFWCFQGM